MRVRVPPRVPAHACCPPSTTVRIPACFAAILPQSSATYALLACLSPQRGVTPEPDGSLSAEILGRGRTAWAHPPAPTPVRRTTHHPAAQGEHFGIRGSGLTVRVAADGVLPSPAGL